MVMLWNYVKNNNDENLAYASSVQLMESIECGDCWMWDIREKSFHSWRTLIKYRYKFKELVKNFLVSWVYGMLYTPRWKF